MDLLSRDEVKSLMARSKGPCISIFMPTHRAGTESQQDPIRLKNLLRQAEELLIERGLRPLEAKGLLQPAQDLIQDSLFWSHQSDGLSIFLSEGYFSLHRLPLNFDELVAVADRFHLKPILPLFSGDIRFYVLALSQNQIRLLHGTRYGVDEVELDGVPQSLAEALQYDQTEKQLKWHTQRAGPGGKRVGLFHGHGEGVDDAKDNILRYLREVDKGLHDLIGQDQAPLILAGVEYLFPIYREANTYPYLLEQGVPGNPERLSAQELHQQALEIIQPYLHETQEAAVAQYYELAGTGRTSKDLKKVVEAAYQGRIEVLFVAIGVQRWGTFDPDSNDVHVHDEQQLGDEDLLDLAAIQTFLQGGTVYAVQPENVPDDRLVAAIFRY